ncbi:hypothetical protein CLF_111641 [Clonorchis sinensis]|uniref:Uncharacterized protein n=1 Tax=Clonorchis sinensis TaxID=79923 RepID=G7YV59_CLOSI|nr:hypothetical protein CLF_111641 [Clonorchis sinensis]
MLHELRRNSFSLLRSYMMRYACVHCSLPSLRLVVVVFIEKFRGQISVSIKDVREKPKKSFLYFMNAGYVRRVSREFCIHNTKAQFGKHTEYEPDDSSSTQAHIFAFVISVCRVHIINERNSTGRFRQGVNSSSGPDFQNAELRLNERLPYATADYVFESLANRWLCVHISLRNVSAKQLPTQYWAEKFGWIGLPWYFKDRYLTQRTYTRLISLFSVVFDKYNNSENAKLRRFLRVMVFLMTRYVFIVYAPQRSSKTNLYIEFVLGCTSYLNCKRFVDISRTRQRKTAKRTY